MSSNYQINLTVNAISKFNDIEKQFKKSLNNLSKILDNTSATLNKQTQKAFNSRLKQLKDLNDAEIQGLKKKNKLSESVLKNQSLNQVIANSLLQKKGDLEIEMTKKKSKALDDKNKKDLQALDKKNKLIEKTNQEKFEKASLDRLGSTITNKQKEIKVEKEKTNLIKKQYEVLKTKLGIKKSELDIEGKIIKNEKDRVYLENYRINARERAQDRKHRQMYAKGRFYEDVGRAGFYYGTLPATVAAGISLRNAMSIGDQERSLKLYAKSEAPAYRKLGEDIASKTSLDIQSVNRLMRGILSSRKDAGIMNIDQATKIIKDIAIVSSSFAPGPEEVERVMFQYMQGASRGYFTIGEDIRHMESAGLAFLKSEYKKIFGKDMEGKISIAQMNKIFQNVAQRPEVIESYLQRQKDLSGAFDQFNNSLLLSSASLGDFINKQYSVSEKLNLISDALDSAKKSFYRMTGKETEEPTAKDRGIAGAIKGIGGLLLAPIAFLVTGYFTKLYTNYIRGNVGKVFGSKAGIIGLSLPLILDFQYFRNILKDFQKDGFLPAISKNFIELGAALYLMRSPLGRFIVVSKLLFEFLSDKIQYIKDHFSFDLLKFYVKDVIADMSAPEGTPTFDDKIAMERKINQAEVIAAAVEKGTRKGSKEGTRDGIEEANKNTSKASDYSLTGKPAKIANKEKNNNNVRVYLLQNPTGMSFGKNNPDSEY